MWEKKLFNYFNKVIGNILGCLFIKYEHFFLVGGKILDLLLNKLYKTISFNFYIHIYEVQII